MFSTAPVVRLARVTLPLDTTKSPLSNLEIPLLVSDASSPVTVIVLSVTTVLIPSPAAIVRVSPNVKGSSVPVSAARVNAVPVEVTLPITSKLPPILTLPVI